MANSYLRSLLLDRFKDPFHSASQSHAGGHIVELDSLRGVAAVFVVFDHFMRVWIEASPPHFVHYLDYLPFLTNGHAAVMMFFVLSGFVLTLPMLSGKNPSYPAYVVRRVSRIYLPYLAALMLALAGCWRFHGLERYTNARIFFILWHEAPTWPLVAQHLAFLGRYNVYTYNPPIWSLVHEMRISIIFPLLALIALRLRSSAAMGIALAFVVAGRLIEKHTGPFGDIGTSTVSWAATIGFCSIFLVGSLLARYRAPIVASLTALPAVARLGLLAVAIALYQYPMQLHVPVGMRNLLTGVAAAYLVMLALVPGGGLSQMLRLAPLRFLGRISYSLYLVHSPILIVMSIAIWGKVPYGYLLAPFLATALAAAAFFHHFVEKPSIALGKTLTARSRSPVRVVDVVSQPIS